MLLIAASILAARQLAQFDGGRKVPATMGAIADELDHGRDWSAPASGDRSKNRPARNRYLALSRPRRGPGASLMRIPSVSGGRRVDLTGDAELGSNG